MIVFAACFRLNRRAQRWAQWMNKIFITRRPIMNNQDKEANNQQVTIEDLKVNQEQEAEVKGGPIFMEIEGIRGSVTPRP
jgi:hypothetical protein